MADFSTYWAWLQNLPRYYMGGTYRLINEKPVFLWAQAIAFKVLVTIVPVVILATGVLALVLREDQAFQTVANYIRDFIPTYRGDQLIDFLYQLQGAGNVITLVGILGLLFSVMTLFTTLRVVVSSVFQEEWHETRSILGGYVFDIRMAAQVGLLFLLSFVLSLGMNALNAAGTEWMESVGLDYGWLHQGWQRTFATFGVLLPFLISVSVFFQLFFFIPKPHPPKRSALIGAGVTSLLYELAKYGFTFYASQVGRFDRYTVADPEPGGTAISGLVDTFGLIIAFVFWVYYSGIVLCIGAILGLLHEKRYRVRRKREQIEQLQQPVANVVVPEAAEVDHTYDTVPAEPQEERAPNHEKAREDLSV